MTKCAYERWGKATEEAQRKEFAVALTGAVGGELGRLDGFAELCRDADVGFFERIERSCSTLHSYGSTRRAR